MAEIITLSEAKKQCRLEEDDTFEDDYIKMLVSSADEYVRDATGFLFPDPNKVPKRAKLAALMLVEHWYNNRGVQLTGMTSSPSLEFSVRQLLRQLEYSYIEEVL